MEMQPEIQALARMARPGDRWCQRDKLAHLGEFAPVLWAVLVHMREYHFVFLHKSHISLLSNIALNTRCVNGRLLCAPQHSETHLSAPLVPPLSLLLAIVAFSVSRGPRHGSSSTLVVQVYKLWVSQRCRRCLL